ncbi:hypothetical protein B0H14DRAFT_3557669 [Mycena olivaceomarginata]|nr:hypothetical protein B0H14DRAFT_3557669 [Mycena olivaceomarginata]
MDLPIGMDAYSCTAVELYPGCKLRLYQELGVAARSNPEISLFGLSATRRIARIIIHSWRQEESRQACEGGNSRRGKDEEQKTMVKQRAESVRIVRVFAGGGGGRHGQDGARLVRHAAGGRGGRGGVGEVVVVEPHALGRRPGTGGSASSLRKSRAGRFHPRRPVSRKKSTTRCCPKSKTLKAPGIVKRPQYPPPGVAKPSSQRPSRTKVKCGERGTATGGADKTEKNDEMGQRGRQVRADARYKLRIIRTAEPVGKKITEQGRPRVWKYMDLLQREEWINCPGDDSLRTVARNHIIPPTHRPPARRGGPILVGAEVQEGGVQRVVEHLSIVRIPTGEESSAEKPRRVQYACRRDDTVRDENVQQQEVGRELRKRNTAVSPKWGLRRRGRPAPLATWSCGYAGRPVVPPSIHEERPSQAASTIARLLIAAGSGVLHAVRVGMRGVPFSSRSESAGTPPSLAHADEVDTVAVDPTPQVQARRRWRWRRSPRARTSMWAVVSARCKIVSTGKTLRTWKEQKEDRGRSAPAPPLVPSATEQEKHRRNEEAEKKRGKADGNRAGKRDVQVGGMGEVWRGACCLADDGDVSGHAAVHVIVVRVAGVTQVLARASAIVLRNARAFPPLLRWLASAQMRWSWERSDENMAAKLDEFCCDRRSTYTASLTLRTVTPITMLISRKCGDWIQSDLPQTCDAALRLVHSVPPVKLGGESVKTKDMSKTEMAVPPLKCAKLIPDWMDQVVADVDFAAITIPKTQRINMAGMLMLNHKEPRGPDTVEQTVDDMHNRWVLEPAAAIAGIVMGKEIEVTYAPQTDGAATDLRGVSRNYIVAEDKRGRVWLEHESKVLALLEVETFPSYSKQHDPRPEPAVRICVQIYVQMHKFQAFYGKIFSPCGVIYVRRGASEDELEFSRVYHDLDDDVRRTACLIIEAERHSSGQYAMPVPAFIRSISEIWPFRVIFAWFYRQVCIYSTIAFAIPNVLRHSDCGCWAARRPLVPV